MEQMCWVTEVIVSVTSCQIKKNSAVFFDHIPHVFFLAKMQYSD